MTTREIVQVFHGRRAGKGKWRAVCPVHGGKHSGPLLISEKKNGATGIYCFGACETQDVLRAVGLTFSDLFPGRKSITPELQRSLENEKQLERLEHQYGLAIMARAVFPDERRYWAAVEQNLFEKIYWLRSEIFPSEKKAREKEAETQRIIAEYGIECLWECLPNSLFNVHSS